MKKANQIFWIPAFTVIMLMIWFLIGIIFIGNRRVYRELNLSDAFDKKQIINQYKYFIS